MRNWRLSVAAIAVGAVVWLGWSFGGRLLAPRRPLNVLLVSIDTLRADHVGAYGYAAAQTPTLDALARRGVRFTDASTVTPLTLPAHTSLLTGTFPAWHGVRDNGGFYVSEDQTTLAEVLRARGYRTGGFVGAFVLDSRWGLGQGFDRYFDDFDLSKYEGRGLDAVQRSGADVVDRAVAWLDEDRERPFFAWVHLYDPHTPYEAPDTIRARFPATLSGAYDAEISSADTQVGRLIARLETAGRLDSTLVVVVGDHGESLGEHQEQTHGFFVYDATIRIPLLIAGPGIPAKPVDGVVRIVDVMPTILEALAIAPPAAVQGRPLRPLWNGERLDLMALAETFYPRYHYGWSDLQTIADGRYKLIAAPRRELYDLRDDPGETRNIAESNAARADALERGLHDLQGRLASREPAKTPQPMDPEAEERLRALGYVGGSVSARNLEEKPRGDPKDTIRLYNLLHRAAEDSVAGRIDEATAKVREALAEDSNIVEGYTMLGNLHSKAKRYEEAVRAYQAALRLDPEHQGAAFSLALAYKQMGRLADAEAGFARALELDPRSGKNDWQLADVAMQRGDSRKAADVLEATLRDKKVDRPAFLVKLAEALIEQRRYDEAERRLKEALAIRADSPMAHYDLGLIAEARGERQLAIAEYEMELRRPKPSYRASFNLARLLAGERRTAEAIAYFRNAVAANPEFGTGYLYLAKSLLDTGDLGGSEQAARKGLALSPDRDAAPLGHYVLADVYMRQGRQREAMQEVALGKKLERGG
jgi:choline-sulfatase